MKGLSDAMKFVLRWEGGYVNHPNDPGGATNMGVTQGVYNSFRAGKDQPLQDVKLISRSEIEAIYEQRYWRTSRAAWLSWPLSLAVMDIAVNSGVGRSNQFMNEVFGFGKSTEWNPGIGKLVHEADPVDIAKKLCDRREKFYKSLALRNPKMKVFLKGWLNRNNALRKEIELAA